MINLFYYKML